MSSVRFLHIRNIEDKETGSKALKGGKTLAYCIEGDQMTYAVAECGRKENYCRRTGRLISEGRLLAGKNQTVTLEAKPIETLLALENGA